MNNEPFPIIRKYINIISPFTLLHILTLDKKYFSSKHTHTHIYIYILGQAEKIKKHVIRIYHPKLVVGH